MTPDWPEHYIARDERILWTGKPAWHFPWAQLDGLAVAGPLIMLLFIWCAAQMPAEEFHFAIVIAVWGVVAAICLVPLWLMFSAFVYRPWLIRHTEYIVTDRRVLRRRGRIVDGMAFLSMPEPKLERCKSGRGTIRFAHQDLEIAPEQQLRATPNSRSHFSLDHIDNAEKVCLLIRAQREAALPMLLPQVREMSLLPVEREERVLWQGRAKLRLRDALPVPYFFIGAMLTVTALMFRLVLHYHPGSIPQPVPFLVENFYLQIGAFLLIERTVRMLWRCRHAAYLITDRRVICKWGRKTSSLPLSAVPGTFLAEDNGRLGTLIITLGREAILLRGLTEAPQVLDILTSAIRSA